MNISNTNIGNKKNEIIISTGQKWKEPWDAFVEKYSEASIFHLFCWQYVISQTYGHKSFYIMHRCEKEILGVLPLVWLKSRLFGNVLTSMPYLDYGGICTAEETSRKALCKKALELRDICKAQYLELRQTIPNGSDDNLRSDKVDMVLDLSMGNEYIWEQFKPKVRNQVRKANKSGLTTKIGGAELINNFYRVFSINMRDLGSPVHSYMFFINIFKQYGEKARIITVCDGNKTVGALICLIFKDSVFVPWASTLREYFPKCPNNLLYWDTIQYACDKGYRFFHFGRSTKGSGTYKFKQQWGAQERQLYWEYYYRKHEQPHTPMAENPKYQMAARIWRRMPLSITLLLGPRIRKYLAN